MSRQTLSPTRARVKELLRAWRYEPDGTRRRWTVREIADECGVTPQRIYQQIQALRNERERRKNGKSR